jgi:hypothetical protein
MGGMKEVVEKHGKFLYIMVSTWLLGLVYLQN